MSIKKAIGESYIFNLIILIKKLAANSFLFNVQRISKEKPANISKKYKPWNEYSLIYKLLMRVDMVLRRLENFTYNSIKNSKIINHIKGYDNNKDYKIKKDNPLLDNSKMFAYFKKIKKSINLGHILVSLTIGYIFVDVIIRRVGFLASFGSIWDELLLIMLFLYVIYSRISSGGNIDYNFTPMGLPAVMYILLGITHVMMVSPDLSVAIEGFRAVFQQVLWYFPIAQLIRNRKDSNRAINIMIVMGFFMGIHATYQYIARVPMPGNWVDVTENIRTRAFSIVGSPNILGALFVLFIPIGIAKFLTNKNKNSRIFYLLSVLFMTLGLFFTLSRGAWLAFAFSMFIFIIIINIKLMLPFMALGGIFILSGSSMSQRLLFMLSPSYMIKSAAGGRLYRWEIGMDIWRRNKLLGVGLGRFGGAVAINNQLAPFYLDNYYLKTMTEMGLYGIIGLIFVIICFTLFTAKIIKCQNHIEEKLVTIGLFAGAAGVLAQNFVENIFEVPAMAIYFWVIVALINTFAPESKSN